MRQPAMIQRLLGHSGRDPGCDACFEAMDEYAELRAGGEDAAGRLPEVAAHLRDCAACREDVDGLEALLRDERRPAPDAAG